MSDYKDSLKRLSDILIFLKENYEFVDWKKFNKNISKLDLQLKKCMISSNEIEEIFLNKKIFPILTNIKDFILRNFKIEIKGKTKAEILPQITYYSIILPHIISETKKIINSIDVSVKAQTVKRPKTIKKKKKVIITETWKDWTKFAPNDLKSHLDAFTVVQIKSIIGKLLPSKEKNVKRAILINNVVKKINKLKVHYQMGPA